jgi:spermidine synthase
MDPQALIVVALVILLAFCQSGLVRAQGVLVHEVRSAYSHIQIRDAGARRAMLFVGDRGESVLETVINLREPHRLQHPYSHTLMAGLLYGPEPRTALLIGLGGGAIVRFLNHEFPRMRLDVVEIDPVVVKLAREYFGIVAGERTRIITDDAFDFLARSAERYDLILVNAHLMPGEHAGATGVPLRLAAREFLVNLRKQLTPAGVVTFNLIRGSDTATNVALIRESFREVELFRSAARANLIVVALAGDARARDDALRERAQGLDHGADRGFSFERLLDERETRHDMDSRFLGNDRHLATSSISFRQARLQ